ncbi:MAG: RNA ligase family protein [Pseudomonadota bacterium]
MKGVPLRCVVDTNVITTANANDGDVPASCVLASAAALQAVMAKGHVFLDDGFRILQEYIANANARGEPGPGDAFLKWLLTHEWDAARVTHVPITEVEGDATSFVELPAPRDGTVYDPSDRKFLAVAAAHPEHPPVLQSFDSKWWGWRAALAEIGVTIHFLCEDAIEKKYDEKMGTGEFFRFPRTPHLVWLGEGQPRDDKVLAPHELEEFLSHELVLEEKIDGANLGFSVAADGTLRAQNRGKYLRWEEDVGQFKTLGRWLRDKEQRLIDALYPDLMLFGEWCYAVHHVRYDRLPDWFLAFDVYDRARGEFWSVPRRNALARELGLSVVPSLGAGKFDLPALLARLGNSKVATGAAEGIYLRYDEGDRLIARAKLVRREFVQSIDEHWSKRLLETNTLATRA